MPLRAQDWKFTSVASGPFKHLVQRGEARCVPVEDETLAGCLPVRSAMAITAHPI
jgi:hypothetical protein